ncbi:hypothetical protein LSH36_76g00073 [Paralvinella palmiformis]|uniref:SPIN90/Ldb17 leucine-rich domain-containing protein n=1 Tax=Paralvinella palmiformis TaxID=53620 RepID=A0AAD9NCK5_9ANNE|nr:hypothetical protein LSH36_76g00073 [Paralvinella palmiformis]
MDRRLTRRMKLRRSHSAKPWGQSKKTHMIPETLYNDLVNNVRNRVNISHTMSKAVVTIIISYVRDSVPSLKNVMQEILQQQDKVQLPDELDYSEDATALHGLFKRIDLLNANYEQRNYSTQEDENTTADTLSSIFDILLGADPEICRMVIAEDNYNNVELLILFYQLVLDDFFETRPKIREMLLRIFGRLCFVDNYIISVLVSSVLPAELARDMMSDELESLSEEFVVFLLTMVKDVLGTEEASKVFGVILACNLHFHMPEKNYVMDALVEVKQVDFFFEEMFFLHSIRVDLVHFIPQEDSRDAVVKILTDVFARSDTATLMSINKQIILVDLIFTRLVANWKQNKISLDYMTLFYNMLKTTNYKQHRHHEHEFRDLFEQITGEELETAEVKRARSIINKIRNEFPDLF